MSNRRRLARERLEYCLVYLILAYRRPILIVGLILLVYAIATIFLNRIAGFAALLPVIFLLLHGEHDQRVPIWQGYEFHNALNRRGIPTEMVVYPRTGHVPSEPKLLLDVMERILAWMELYLEHGEIS